MAETKFYNEFRNSKPYIQMEFVVGEYRGTFRQWDDDGNLVEERPITDADIDRIGIRGTPFWRSLTEGEPGEWSG